MRHTRIKSTAKLVKDNIKEAVDQSPANPRENTAQPVEKSAARPQRPIDPGRPDARDASYKRGLKL